ncbi:MAG: hypothetical protein Q4G05_01450 [Clostridia bacterium]|nr:hypothetical protein [Clostridia bacterium]
MLLELLNKFNGTEIIAPIATGINKKSNDNLDCNCIDCGDDADCSTPW